MTPPSTATANAYLRTRVLTASPEELRLMLLEGAVKFARQGRQGITDRDYNAMYQGLSQARDIVFELLNTIRDDVDPDLAANAKALYSFLYRLIVEASFEKDPAKADTAIQLLEYEHQTWVMLMDRLAAERGIARPAAQSPAAQAPGTPAPSLSIQG
jgi:flagellar secretion chaperone FliS